VTIAIVLLLAAALVVAVASEALARRIRRRNAALTDQGKRVNTEKHSWGAEIVKAAASTGGWASNFQAPALRNGQLVIGLTPPFSSVLPPTDAGWREYLRLAPRAKIKFQELAQAGLFWWDRRIPPDLLSAARVSPEAPQSKAA